MKSKVSRFVLDRWEGAAGVLEGVGPVPRALLPGRLQEGDVVVVTVSEDSVTLTRDPAETHRRRERAQRLRDSLTVAEGGEDDVFDL